MHFVAQLLGKTQATGQGATLCLSLTLNVVTNPLAGKSELINSLLGRPVLSTSAFKESTRRIRSVKGNVAGELSASLIQ
jgi:GTPase Era involved in 16S rRNA processing